MPDIEITRYSIETWIKTIATGEFHYKNVLGLERVLTPKEDSKLRSIIFELCQRGVCESVGKRDGYYRAIQEKPRPINWQNGEFREDSGLILPFDLRKYVFIYPDTTIVIAGSKSSGKTGFIYRTVGLNMNRVNTILLTNLEGGKSMLRDRFNSLDIEIPKPAPFEVIQANENFHHFITEKDTFYAIDYIDAPEGTDFYMIGGLIKKIDQKLQGLNSNALIGLQKPVSRDTAFGGEQTLKTATLYLAIDNRKLKIVDAKVPTNSNLHPKNMQWTFKYDNSGTNFTNIQQSYGGDAFV